MPFLLNLDFIDVFCLSLFTGPGPNTSLHEESRLFTKKRLFTEFAHNK